MLKFIVSGTIQKKYGNEAMMSIPEPGGVPDYEEQKL
jgi:hypothetical protein